MPGGGRDVGAVMAATPIRRCLKIVFGAWVRRLPVQMYRAAARVDGACLCTGAFPR